MHKAMEEKEGELFGTKFLDNWFVQYQKLETYLEQPRNAQLSQANAIEEELVKWINIQCKIKNKLPLELKNKLAALDFDYNQKINIWEHRYEQLVSFAKVYGHTHLPADDERYEELRDWLLRQIQGKKYLSGSRFTRLDLLGVNWFMVMTRDQRWEQMYLKLKEFYQTNGHCQVPQKWKSDKTLANWVRVQRRLHANNQLHPERTRKLQEINFIWHIQTIYEAQWQHFYQELKKFYQAHGHCRVPGKNKHLTSWTENQRTAKKKKSLLANREQQLNEINFIWAFKDLRANQWEEKYKQLGAFKKKHGHCFVPVNYKENKSLGSWIASQRKLEATGHLEEGKKKKLSQLGFVWSTHTQQQLKSSYDAQWSLHFERLKIYQQVYGSCQVSLKINPELQRWTKWQRILFYQGRLSEERMIKLNDINFPWNVQEGYWMKMYEALTDFRKQFGHTRVPYQWAANRQLAAWVYRLKFNKQELGASKVKLLNIIGFDWQLNRKTVVSWEMMYSRLLEFKQENGHTRVPVKWLPDPKLGKWVSRMRQEKDKLNMERLTLLQRIGFDWGCQLVRYR